jgi:hypothetical protein
MRLFAWVKRVSSNSSHQSLNAGNTPLPADHTWVTSYDNRKVRHYDIADVIKAGDDFWYCWGDFHWSAGTDGTPDGLIESGGANLALAQCVVTQNKETSTNVDAQGTVFRYRKDGVCHQLANQVLYATASATSPALTVAKAWGYWLSAGRWNTYGRQEAKFWSKVASCGSGASEPSKTARAPMGEQSVPNLVDEFAVRVRETIGRKNPDLAQRLMALREELQKADENAPDTESLEESDERGNKFLADARNLLGDPLYRQMFELEPGQRVSFPSAAE